MEKRIAFFYALTLFIFIIIIVRLFFWQVRSFENLSILAGEQSKSNVAIPPKRGRIFTRDGSPLVLNQKAFQVYSTVQTLKEPLQVVRDLSKILELDEASLSAKLTDSKAGPWVSIADRVDEDKAERIKSLNFEGIGLIEKSKRFYPEASMAAHLLGFVGKNTGGEDQGYFGIEGKYDEQLRGRPGFVDQEIDALGNPILSFDIARIPPEDGRDIYTTIDKTVQYIIETKLKEGIEKYEAKGGTATVMDPFTGEILAMASFPSYDPASFWSFNDSYYPNPVTAFSYEPGSTFKVLIMAAAFNEKKIEPDTEFEEEGPLEIGGYKVETWNKKYLGTVKPEDILVNSSNVGMVMIGESLGNDGLKDYINRFGFGSLTGIDVQEEQTPALRGEKNWYPIDYATATFGQGIAVTPIQMLRAVSSIVNGGILYKPIVVSKIVISDEREVIMRPVKESIVLSKRTSAIMKELMLSAVDLGETRKLKPQGYKIGGKTGTAQIPIAGHYDRDKTIASFIGFAPFDNPKFVMLVTINEPSSSTWGSETAAPVFFRIAKELFTYWGLPQG